MRSQFRFPVLSACVFPIANQLEPKLILDMIVKHPDSRCAHRRLPAAPRHRKTPPAKAPEFNGLESSRAAPPRGSSASFRTANHF